MEEEKEEKISKLIKTILKQKKLQQISQETYGLIIPGSWLRAMGWNRQIIFNMEFHPLNKEIIIRQSEEISNPDKCTD